MKKNDTAHLGDAGLGVAGGLHGSANVSEALGVLPSDRVQPLPLRRLRRRVLAVEAVRDRLGVRVVLVVLNVRVGAAAAAAAACATREEQRKTNNSEKRLVY